MTSESWEYIRPVIAKMLAIGGLLLTSAGILGNPRLEKLERLNRKFRRRIKFSNFFYSSRPIIGKVFLYYSLAVYAILVFTVLRSPEFRADISGTIIALLGMAISTIIIFGIINSLIKYKNPRQAYIATNNQMMAFLPKPSSELPVIKIFDLPVFLPFIPFNLLILFSAFYFWFVINLVSVIVSINLSLLLFPYKMLETLRIKTKLRGSIVTAGVIISVIGVLLD